MDESPEPDSEDADWNEPPSVQLAFRSAEFENNDEYFLNEMPSFLPIEDFNQISSVWARCKKWQDTLAFEGPKYPQYIGLVARCFLPHDFLKSSLHTTF